MSKVWLEKILKMVRVILIIIPVVILVFLVSKDFAWSGRLEVRYNFCKDSPFILPLFPKGRALDIKKDKNDCFQPVAIDPVYFYLQMPRWFEGATVHIKYKNPGFPIIELGAQKRHNEWDYDLKPLENRLIDSLSWTKIQKENVVLLQKNKRFDTISDFLNYLPKGKKVVFYNYELPSYFYRFLRVEQLNIYTNLEDADYIIATYASPKEQGEYQESQAFFQLKDYYVENNKLRFMLSVPSLDESGKELRLKEIRVILEKEPLTFENFISRLRGFLGRILYH